MFPGFCKCFVKSGAAALFSALFLLNLGDNNRSGFGGGMARMREVCGAVSGMFMAAGLILGDDGAAITRAIGGELAALDPAHRADYEANTADYAGQLDRLDETFRAFFDSLEDRTIVFGDRFPLRYFAEEYDLDYYAAFPGCGTQTEPSAATIAFLTDKVRTEGISTVWYIEFSNHLVADSIAEATGTRTALFHTCHNISREDLAAGATYLSLMEGNLDRLRTAMAP